MTEAQVKKFIAGGTRRTRQEIMAETEDLIRGFTSVPCQRQEVGPIRRGENSARAIELLLTHPYRSVRSKLVGSLNLRCSDIDMSNEDIWTMTFYGTRVVLYFATRPAFVAQMLIRTGPEDFVSGLQHRARARGYRLDNSGFYAGEELLKPFDESGIFQALGLEYVPPQKRAATTFYKEMEK